MARNYGSPVFCIRFAPNDGFVRKSGPVELHFSHLAGVKTVACCAFTKEVDSPSLRVRMGYLFRFDLAAALLFGAWSRSCGIAPFDTSHKYKLAMLQ